MADKKITIKQYTGTGTNYDTLYHAKVQEKIRLPNETNRSRIFNMIIYLPYF